MSRTGLSRRISRFIFYSLLLIMSLVWLLGVQSASGERREIAGGKRKNFDKLKGNLMMAMLKFYTQILDEETSPFAIEDNPKDPKLSPLERSSENVWKGLSKITAQLTIKQLMKRIKSTALKLDDCDCPDNSTKANPLLALNKMKLRADEDQIDRKDVAEKESFPAMIGMDAGEWQLLLMWLNGFAIKAYCFFLSIMEYFFPQAQNDNRMLCAIKQQRWLDDYSAFNHSTF